MEGKSGAFQCPKCKATIASSGDDYCRECGEPLTIACSHCGFIWRFWQNYKFCPKCGAKAEKVGVKPGRRGLQDGSIFKR